jgi:tripartite-type tricarboxylate transporter receptor subunit TctC
MKHLRRFVASFAVITLGAALSALAPAAAAQRYPDRSIKLIVPVPPGGGVDILSRAVGARMQQSMGVPVVVENKAGASAAIGTEALAKSPPDGKGRGGGAGGNRSLHRDVTVVED